MNLQIVLRLRWSPLKKFTSITMINNQVGILATPLFKALLTVGLLSGGGLAALGAGSAQAVGWVPSSVNQTTTPPPLGPGHPYFNIETTKWNFDQIGGTGTTNHPHSNFANGVCAESDPFCTSPVIADKQVTLLQWSSIPGDPLAVTPRYSNLEFSLVPGDSHPWHVDLDLNPDDLDGGSLAYKIAIVTPINNDLCVSSLPAVFCGIRFGGVRLSSGAAVTKVYGTGYDANAIDPRDNSPGIVTGIIDILTTPSSPDYGPGGPSVLYVKDYWNGGQVVDNLENAFYQVPGPLPIVGVGMGFGFSRNLRHRLKQFKKISCDC